MKRTSILTAVLTLMTSAAFASTPIFSGVDADSDGLISEGKMTNAPNVIDTPKR